MQLGPTELIIILVIVLLLFGVGRIGKIGNELGSGIRSFREGLQGDKDESKEDAAHKGNQGEPTVIPAAEPTAKPVKTDDSNDNSRD